MSKEEEFKERFVATMQDLRGATTGDPELMFLIGSLATRLLDRSTRTSWPEFKSKMARQTYDRLLAEFGTQGNAFYAEGKNKHAEAIKVLAMSLIARTQTDPDVVAGNTLLDEMIGTLIASFRKAKAMDPVKH